jgi:hypothetical protein
MSIPSKIKTRLLDASYVPEAKSILLLLECSNGKFRSQIPRDAIATFGNRTETEITKEMLKYVEILKCCYVGKDKFINSIFDPDLDERIKDHSKIKY